LRSQQEKSDIEFMKDGMPLANGLINSLAISKKDEAVGSGALVSPLAKQPGSSAQDIKPSQAIG
jgi:hypothetical protein